MLPLPGPLCTRQPRVCTARLEGRLQATVSCGTEPPWGHCTGRLGASVPSPASPVQGVFLAPHCSSSCPQFLRDTLTVVSDNTWTCQLSLEMSKQLPCYNGIAQEKVHRGRGVPQQGVLGTGLRLPSSCA